MRLHANQLELLSPARDAAIAREAILHGADAVYIGGPGFGARHNAGNSLADIANLVEFAHRYRAKIFVTLNTILHDNELDSAQTLIHKLYHAGVDALIVQDMGILELDIPPIELHASTQCDIRSVEKARFLSDVGFSQIVLARELNLQQIADIHQHVDATIEFFIHGALCVAYSGQCYISHAQTGRSANRGDCSQACRLPYTLRDTTGQVVAWDKHLLSMKDNDQTANLAALVDAGVRSFKIEGRYKDMSYVKNITAWYRQRLNALLEERGSFSRASLGRTEHFFTPSADKTFHRGSTDYFVNERKADIGAFDSPKFVGLPVGKLVQVGKDFVDIIATAPLANGDGLNVLIKREVVGLRVNVANELSPGRYRVWPNELPAALRGLRLPHPINRNLDHNWQQALQKTSSERRIAVDLTLTGWEQQLMLTATAEDGVTVTHYLDGEFAPARDAAKGIASLEEGVAKLGATLYYPRRVEVAIAPLFVPNARLNLLRRETIALLDEARAQVRVSGHRKAPRVPAPVFPQTHLSYLANVYNHKARAFYQRHGVTLIDAAYEAHEEKGEVPVMITKHCLRFAFNMCPKLAKGVKEVKAWRATPMQLQHQDEVLTLTFDCKACEMHVLGKIKPHILKIPQAGSELGAITPQALLNTLPGKSRPD